MKLKRPNKLKSADPDSAEEAGKIEPAYGSTRILRCRGLPSAMTDKLLAWFLIGIGIGWVAGMLLFGVAR